MRRTPTGAGRPTHPATAAVLMTLATVAVTAAVQAARMLSAALGG